MEGVNECKDVEATWTWVVERGVWKVAPIDEGHMSLCDPNLLHDAPPLSDIPSGVDLPA